MRIVLVGPVYPYRGGIAHYTTMLCRTLRDRGHEVLMVSFKRQYPQWLFPGKSDKDPSKKPLEVKGAQYWIDSLNPLTWLTTFWRMWRFGPDVIVLQWWTSFWTPVWFVLGVLNRVLLGRPLIYLCHNVLPHERRVWDPCLTRLALLWGSQFIVQSPQEEERLLRLYPEARIDIVPHPVYDMFAGEKVSREEARARLGLPLEFPILLFFGIVRRYKGLRDVLVALPAVQAQVGKIVLVVAGEIWEDKDIYIEMTDRLRISDSVIIEDRYIPNEEVPLYFSAADVLVAPYRQATGSGAVQMALGCGCPVITTDIEAFEDVIQNRERSLVTPPSDPDALAGTILRYLTEERLFDTSSDQGRGNTRSWSTLLKVIERARQ